MHNVNVLFFLAIIKVVICLTVGLIISRGVLAQRRHQRIKNLCGERTGITLFNHGESSVELKVKTKYSLQLFYLIAAWESDMSDTFLRSRLKCPIEPAFFKYWGKLFHR